MTDFLIIGQGIAGSLLAWKLIHAGNTVLVLDNNHQQCASKISAGVINPIKGIHYTLVEDFDDHYAIAEHTYRKIETEFNINFFQPTPITRIFSSEKYAQKLINRHYPFDWLTINPPNHFDKHIHDEFGSVTINKAALCQTPIFLDKIKQWLLDQNALIHTTFDRKQLIISKNNISYQNITAKKIIFANGFQSAQDPLFDHLPWQLSQGELLTLRINTPFPNNQIIKSKKWLIPKQNNIFIAGSTYDDQQCNHQPSQEARNQIIDGLKKSFSISFDVIDHVAGIRPIVFDHFPVIGSHPKYNNVILFNGLASKGWLWAPTCATQLTDFLLEEKKIDPRFDLKRFV